MSYKLLIGSHVKMRKVDNYLIGSVKEAIKYGANTFMFYTASPQTSKNKPKIDVLNIEEFQKILKENNIKIDNLVIHASYLINLANTVKHSVYQFSLELLQDEIERAIKTGVEILVLHPGSSVGGNRKKSLLQVAEGLNKVLKPNHKIKIAIETMAGKGNEVGKNFDELKSIYENVILKDKIGFCFDTCHLNDAGYDVKNNFNAVLNEFDEKIGLNKLIAIHLNDSKNDSRKDRHENIGYGQIGFESILKIAYHPFLENVPKILETPYINNEPPYKKEISNLKNKKFIEFSSRIKTKDN